MFRAPPGERGGNRYVQPTATAPHLDSTRIGHSTSVGSMSASRQKRSQSLIGPEAEQIFLNQKFGADKNRPVRLVKKSTCSFMKSKSIRLVALLSSFHNWRRCSPSAKAAIEG